MNEREWVNLVVNLLKNKITAHDPSLEIAEGKNLPYAYEVLSYSQNKPEENNIIEYETDILVYETLLDGGWKPRVVIEAKINSVTTHDAITYSQKAATHKQVHPYLRYGILIGNRKHYPLPGRLFRHGAHFDFMLSWQGYQPIEIEMDYLLELIVEEVRASRALEGIIYNSRDPKRKRYTYLHRPLNLK